MRKVKGRSFYKEPWYKSYNSMLQRCENPNASNYDLYGGRGITVCDEWHDIEVFEQWVKESNYQVGLTIDRIDVNKGYEPNNCRWATKKQQANNRRNTIYVTIDGLTKTLSEWSDFSGINRSTLNSRYCDGVRGIMLLHKVEDTKFNEGYNRYDDKGHYDDMRIKHGNNTVEIWELNGEKHSILEWGKIKGISVDTLRSRRFKGWSIEKTLTTPIKTNKYGYKNDPKINGQYVRALRQSYKLTMKDLAKRIGVGESTVQSWETGKRKISTPNIIKLCEIFNVTVDDLSTIIPADGGD